MKVTYFLFSLLLLFSCNFLIRGPEKNIYSDKNYINKTFFVGNTMVESNNIKFSIPKNQLNKPAIITIKFLDYDSNLPSHIELQINRKYLKNIITKNIKKNLVREHFIYEIEIESDFFSLLSDSKIENFSFLIINSNNSRELSLNEKDIEILNNMIQIASN